MNDKQDKHCEICNQMAELGEDLKAEREIEKEKRKESFESDACVMEIEADERYENVRTEARNKAPDLEAKLNRKNQFISRVIRNN